jgi:hypothetical protein
MAGFVRGMVVAGGLLVAVGLLNVLAAWGGLDERMRTQVVPRRVAAYLIAAGVALLLIAMVASAFP